MSMVLDAGRSSFWKSLVVVASYLAHYNTLLQNATDVITECLSHLIQNATNVYHKMQQLYWKMRHLKQNASVQPHIMKEG